MQYALALYCSDLTDSSNNSIPIGVIVVDEINKKGFNYNQKNSAASFFVVKPKKEIIIEGPFLKDKNNNKPQKHT